MAGIDDFAKEVHLTKLLPILPASTASTALTAAQFQQLADVPPAMTWFANIDNPQTRRAYQNDLQELVLGEQWNRQPTWGSKP